LKEDISCGALTERLLSSLIPDKESNETDEDNDEDSDDYLHQGQLDANDFENRLMTELQYVGLFADDDVRLHSIRFLALKRGSL
jgi:hypothetical protein